MHILPGAVASDLVLAGDIHGDMAMAGVVMAGEDAVMVIITITVTNVIQMHFPAQDLSEHHQVSVIVSGEQKAV